MKLYAWIGEDEFGSGVIGLKQGVTALGIIPLVATERHKIDTPSLRMQLQQQATIYRKTIRLAEFECVVGDLATVEPT